MSETIQPMQKVCRVCGRDCSTIARVRNSRGDYFCKPCHDALAAKAAALRSEADSGETYGVTGGSNDAFFAENALMPCPKCGRPSPKQTVVCTVCGFNWETGNQLRVQELHDDPPAERPGTDARAEYEQKREAAAKAMWRHEHFKAIGMIVVGLLGSMIAIGTLGGSDGDYLVGEYFVEFGINWIVGIGAFWLCSITFLGVDSPLYLSGLRLGAAYAMSDLAFLATAPFITPLLAFFVMLGCYISLLMTLFELDLTDAALLAVSLFAVKLVIYFVTAMLIFTAST